MKFIIIGIIRVSNQHVKQLVNAEFSQQNPLIRLLLNLLDVSDTIDGAVFEERKLQRCVHGRCPHTTRPRGH